MNNSSQKKKKDQKDFLKDLAPNKVKTLKGQIGALLNYTTQGGGAVTPINALKDLKPTEVKKLKAQIAALLNYTTQGGGGESVKPDMP